MALINATIADLQKEKRKGRDARWGRMQGNPLDGSGSCALPWQQMRYGDGITKDTATFAAYHASHTLPERGLALNMLVSRGSAD